MNVNIKNSQTVLGHSQELDQLFGALSKLQGKLENATKNKSGYTKGHKYADLGQYIDESKELLAEHGLCIMQFPGEMEIVQVTKEVYSKKDDAYFFHQIHMPKQKVTSCLGHESGQFITTSMEILVEKTSGNSWGQSTGSSISYARRYAISALLNMTDEDDDNQLSKKDNEKSYSTPQIQRAPIHQIPHVPVDPKITPEQVKEVISLLADDNQRAVKILEWGKVSSFEELNLSQYNKLIKRFEEERSQVSQSTKDDTNLISPHQVGFITRLVSPERLNKILKDYNLNKLEEMNVNDYHNEYNILRQETTTTENISNLKKEA